jgi:hypothetical protein
MSRHLGGRNAVVIDCGSWPKYGITPNTGSVEDVDFFVARLKPLCRNLVDGGDADEDDAMAPINKEK